MTRERLEQFAVEAYRNGGDWESFWEQHRLAVSAMYPHDHSGYQRMARRLLALVVSGDTDGVQPIDTAWERPGEWELEEMSASRRQPGE